MAQNNASEKKKKKDRKITAVVPENLSQTS
jgi:hypothetical protein